MQRTYEVMFIMRPDLTEEDADKLLSTLQTHATNAGAQVQNAEKMGKRRLAYDVRKFSEGMYVLLTLLGDGKAIHELERRLRVTIDQVHQGVLHPAGHVLGSAMLFVQGPESSLLYTGDFKLRASRTKRPPAEAAPAEAENPAVSA